jgi:pimeloyl-ACP methyl ester carboxylesterase
MATITTKTRTQLYHQDSGPDRYAFKILKNSMRSAAVLLLPLVGGCMSSAQPDAATPPLPPGTVKNIVLVHGAWADGSSWAKVIPLLQAKGYQVTAVQNPLSSLPDDIAATRRAIALADGPVILVGHSYGGAIITGAGMDPKVVGLVYVAAFAPEAGQSSLEESKAFPATPGGAEIRPDASGFLTLTSKGISEDFVPDLSAVEQQVAFATQGPTAAAALGAKETDAAWKSKPTWFIVASNDRMIAPEQERASASAMKADTTEVHSGHCPMLSHPNEVEAVIERAAAAAASRASSGGE